MARQTLVAHEVASLEGPEYLDPVVGGEVVVEIVEQAVPQTGTDEDGQEHVEQQTVEVAAVDVFAFEHAAHQPVAKHEGQQEGQRVPAQTAVADVYGDGVDVPVYGIYYHCTHCLTVGAPRGALCFSFFRLACSLYLA